MRVVVANTRKISNLKLRWVSLTNPLTFGRELLMALTFGSIRKCFILHNKRIENLVDRSLRLPKTIEEKKKH